MYPIFSRAISDSLQAFDTGFKAIGLTLLGAGITALIVFLVQGWDELKKHVVQNIFILFGGAIATWLLVFVFIFLRLPYKALVESNANLTNVIREKQQLSETVNMLDSQIKYQDSSIATLSQKVVDLQSAGPRIVTHTLPASEPAKQCWSGDHFGFANSTVKGAMTATAVIIYCNYKVEAPYIVQVEFDRDILQGAVTILGSGVVLGGGEAVQGKIAVTRIDSPALLSNQILVFTVYGPTDQYPRALRFGIKSLN